MSLPTLPPLPVVTTELPRGLAAGRLDVDPVFFGARRGRVRRWMYAAAGDETRAVGAAVVDLGFAGTAFVWAVLGGEVSTWERTRVLARGCRVGSLPADGAEQGASERLLGWAGATTPFAGGGWRDWTTGRQDRRTSWHWAAGAGTTRDGTVRVGLNVSTGMNDAGAGEDVVWWAGVPSPLEVSTLAPAGDDVAGPWVVAGPGWRLGFEPVGVRAADEQLVVVASRYVQPVGRFVGTLPGPDGRPREVELTGVTERHVARW